jgi:hypothetical protein
MSLNNAKHVVAEIDGVRCTIIESNVTLERAAFLRDLLEFNNYEVRESKTEPANPGDEPKFTIGVTDIVFNPVFAVFERRLKTREGGRVTPGYWNQQCSDCDPRYWMKKDSKIQ